MKKFNFNFKFLERFRRKKNDEDISEIPNPLIKELDEDNGEYSTENESFAEKTLGSYDIEKFREMTAAAPVDNDAPTDSETLEANEPFTYQEMQPPEKPEVASKFSFKFPKFSSFRKKPIPAIPVQNQVTSETTGTIDVEVTSKEKSKRNFKERFSSASANTMNKFSWNDFILRLFSPYSRSKIHGIFIILFVVTLTYLFGKTMALFLGRSTPVATNTKSSIMIPIEKKDTALQDLNRISSTNLFNVKESDKVTTKEVKKDIASIICLDAEKPTSEPLKLLDTIVLQDSVKSVASVQVRSDSELVNVREGENLNNSMEVSKITRMKVILKNLNTGDCEYIANEEQEAQDMAPNMKILSPKKGAALFKSTNPSIKNVGNNFKIKRQVRDQLVSNIGEVMTQAKAIQITNPDGSLAFKMTEVVPGSIYSNLNIQNEDIITSINGKKIENVNELVNLLGRIKEIDQFQIGLKRNGMSENLEYNFE